MGWRPADTTSQHPTTESTADGATAELHRKGGEKERMWVVHRHGVEGDVGGSGWRNGGSVESRRGDGGRRRGGKKEERGAGWKSSVEERAREHCRATAAVKGRESSDCIVVPV